MLSQGAAVAKYYTPTGKYRTVAGAADPIGAAGSFMLPKVLSSTIPATTLISSDFGTIQGENNCILENETKNRERAWSTT